MTSFAKRIQQSKTQLSQQQKAMLSREIPNKKANDDENEMKGKAGELEARLEEEIEKEEIAQSHRNKQVKQQQAVLSPRERRAMNLIVK